MRPVQVVAEGREDPGHVLDDDDSGAMWPYAVRVFPGLTAAQRALFERGSIVFQVEFAPETGLGPLFNAVGCANCHEAGTMRLVVTNPALDEALK